MLRRPAIYLVRLHSPEANPTCRRDSVACPSDHEATKAFKNRIVRAMVSCERRERDRFRRIVAVCFAAGQDVNR